MNHWLNYREWSWNVLHSHLTPDVISSSDCGKKCMCSTGWWPGLYLLVCGSVQRGNKNDLSHPTGTEHFHAYCPCSTVPWCLLMFAACAFFFLTGHCSAASLVSLHILAGTLWVQHALSQAGVRSSVHGPMGSSRESQPVTLEICHNNPQHITRGALKCSNVFDGQSPALALMVCFTFFPVANLRPEHSNLSWPPSGKYISCWKTNCAYL